MSENSNVIMQPGTEIEEQMPKAPQKAKGKFFREIMAELKKTTWLTKNELIKATVTVLLTITVVSIILFCYDWIAAQIMNFLKITIINK